MNTGSDYSGSNETTVGGQERPAERGGSMDAATFMRIMKRASEALPPGAQRDRCLDYVAHIAGDYFASVRGCEPWANEGKRK